MIAMTLAELASVTGGRLTGITPEAAARVEVTGPVVADSRSARPGGLFVADASGHDFVADAAVRGTSAVLAARELPDHPNLPCVIAPPAADGLPERDHSVIALGRLARHVVDQLQELTVVGITGSSGKTGTKDLLHHLLATAGETVAPEASLNDELGMPLTALRATPSTRFLVLEMGAKGIGHLAYLAEVVPPTIGVVLNVGTAHVGKFGGKQQIAQAKGELVEALPAAGVAVLNADDPLVRAMASRTRARVLLVGEAPDAHVRAEQVELDGQGRASFRLVTPGGERTVRLQLVGRHQVGNALAVASVGLAVGLDLDAVAAGLSTAVRQARWRMEVTERADGVTIVNDAYNANPDSTRSALQTVRALAGDGPDRRTWAVLGEMLELGDVSAAEHTQIGRLAAELGFDHVVAVGDGARPVGEGARPTSTMGDGSGRSVRTTVHWVADADAALALLQPELRHGDVVLVKSSRDAGLRHLGDALVTAMPAEAGLDREESTG